MVVTFGSGAWLRRESCKYNLGGGLLMTGLRKKIRCEFQRDLLLAAAAAVSQSVCAVLWQKYHQFTWPEHQAGRQAGRERPATV